MKTILLLLSSFLWMIAATDPETVREQYPAAHSSSRNADHFAKLVAGGKGNTMDGYKAAARIIQAKYAKGEGRAKLIKEGAAALEQIIKKNPDNAELRLIRLSIQESLPKIINYRSSIEKDKAYLLRSYSAQNSSLKSYIRKFAANSKSFTAADRERLK